MFWGSSGGFLPVAPGKFQLNSISEERLTPSPGVVAKKVNRGDPRGGAWRRGDRTLARQVFE